MLPLIVFSLNVENVGEGCKSKRVCVDQAIALNTGCLLLPLLLYANNTAHAVHNTVQDYTGFGPPGGLPAIGRL